MLLGVSYKAEELPAKSKPNCVFCAPLCHITGKKQCNNVLLNCRPVVSKDHAANQREM